MYRTILRLHRNTLAPDLRALGDNYVKEEFRKHKDAAPEFVEPFFREWDNYVQQLLLGVQGRDLTEAELSSLSEEQLRQLSMLKREATRKLRD